MLLPPQNLSKRSRALSTTSVVTGLTIVLDTPGGEFMPGSSKHRSVDPGTGRSY